MAAKKDDLIAKIQANLGDLTTKKDAELYLNAVLSGILDTVKEHESVRTVLGSFKWVTKPARKAFNPKNKVFVDVAAYDTLTFKTAPSIRQADSIPPVAKTSAKAKTETVAAKPKAKAVAKPAAVAAKTPAAKPVKPAVAKPAVTKPKAK